jgi:hypothetical protein
MRPDALAVTTSVAMELTLFATAGVAERRVMIILAECLADKPKVDHR